MIPSISFAVGKIGVIVHNKCSGSYELDFDNGKKYIGKGTERRMRVSINRIEKIWCKMYTLRLDAR